MLYLNLDEFKNSLKEIVEYNEGGTSRIISEEKLRYELIDRLIYNAVFNGDVEISANCRYLIRTAAPLLGIYPSSIHDLYMAIGKGKYTGFTVPAINIRGMTYDVAQQIFEVVLKENVGPFIFEIARSEIGYTNQWPSEYSVAILAAAIKKGYKGPVFIQGDHFQVKAKIFKENENLEIEAIKVLIKDAIDSGFYNIDVDTSTLVDLSYDTIDEQQRLNYEICALFTKHIRDLEPEGITVSVGGEIGEVGGKNSTPEELRGFMDGYLRVLKKEGDYTGISKISVQTGTAHGGVPLPDGTIAKVKLDFSVLETLGEIAKKEYGIGGVVQHGASTLPDELFHKFPEVKTLEIHLATGFQNIIYDHPAFPSEFKDEIYNLLRTKFIGDKKEGQTDEQFIYKTRKKGFGPFKKKFWDLPDDVKKPIMRSLYDKFHFLFEKLGTFNTRNVVEESIKPVFHKISLDREKDMVK